MGRKLPISFLLVLLGVLIETGCAQLEQFQYFENDPSLQSAAFQLTDDYLKSQLSGESYAATRKKFGSGAVRVTAVKDFQCEGLGSMYGSPAIQCHIQVAEKQPQEAWVPFVIAFNYFPSLRKSNDPYEGLRIQTAGEGRF